MQTSYEDNSLENKDLKEERGDEEERGGLVILFTLRVIIFSV